MTASMRSTGLKVLIFPINIGAATRKQKVVASAVNQEVVTDAVNSADADRNVIENINFYDKFTPASQGRGKLISSTRARTPALFCH